MEEQFEAIARSLYATSHETEKGLRRYEYWRGEEEGLYYTQLSFDDFLSFIAHQTSEHHETASPQIGAVVIPVPAPRLLDVTFSQSLAGPTNWNGPTG